MSDDEYKKESRRRRSRERDGSRKRSNDREDRKRSRDEERRRRRSSSDRRRSLSRDRYDDKREHGRGRGLILTDSTRFEIDQNQVGAIIGRGGSNLREIQHQYSVVINVDKNCNYRGKTGVRVSGDSIANIEDAIHHIKMQIKDNKRRYGRDVGKFRDRDFDRRRFRSPDRRREKSRERRTPIRDRSISPLRDRSPIRERRNGHAERRRSYSAHD